MSKGIKRFIYAISVLALVLVGVFASTRTMSAYTPPQDSFSVAVENVEQVMDLNMNVCYQSLAIPRSFFSNVRQNEYINFLNTHSYLMRDEYILQLSTQVWDANYDASASLEAQYNAMMNETAKFRYITLNGYANLEHVVNDYVGIDIYAYVINGETELGKRIFFTPIMTIITQPINDSPLLGQQSFVMYIAFNEMTNTAYVGCGTITTFTDLLSRVWFEFSEPQNKNRDTDYYYYLLPFSGELKDKNNAISYGNTLPIIYKESLSADEQQLASQRLQDITNLFPGINYYCKLADVIDPESTYQQGYQLGWNTGYNQGVQDTSGKTFRELGWYNWIIGIFETMSMFLSLKIGDISIGYFALIPLIISVVAFIIRMWKGGQGD